METTWKELAVIGGVTYPLIGFLVMLIVCAATDSEPMDKPLLHVGIVVFWPLVVLGLLARSALAVWEWGFGCGKQKGDRR